MQVCRRVISVTHIFLPFRIVGPFEPCYWVPSPYPAPILTLLFQFSDSHDQKFMRVTTHPGVFTANYLLVDRLDQIMGKDVVSMCPWSLGRDAEKTMEDSESVDASRGKSHTSFMIESLMDWKL